MKEQFTIGNALSIFVPVIVILIGWGGTVESRLAELAIQMQAIERNNIKTYGKLDDIDKSLTTILVELQNKKDRE